MNVKNLLLIAVGMLAVACGEDKIEDTNVLNIPSTYNFSPANYSGQTSRIQMLSEMVAYLKTGAKDSVLDAQKLNDMYVNQNNPFANDTLNTSGKQLKDKVNFAAQAMFAQLLDSAAVASQATLPAVDGRAGIITSKDNTKSYLVNASGQEFAQLVEKGMMGALMYYQMVDVYLSEAKTGNSVDNETIVDGQGTAMQHHWDEAFGYFGVPIDFPTNITGLKFVGNYANQRNAIMNGNKVLMDAFLKGRAAIGAKQYTSRDEAIGVLKTNLELVLAGSAIHYMNEVMQQFDDAAIRCHALSEGYGFIQGLKYNSNASITPSQVDELLTLIGTNFHQVTLANLQLVKDKLADYYNLNNVKNTL